MKLSKYEQETIINFNEQEPEASIYTYNAKLKAKLKKMADCAPEACVYVSQNHDGGVTYRIQKKLISVRQPYSEERRKRDQEIALAANRRPPSKGSTEENLQEQR